jgi:type II secretory pathway pseudopilin PulG
MRKAWRKSTVTIIKPSVSRRTRHRIHGDEHGITLIEVLSAMIVLAVGILGLAPLMTLSITSNQFASEVTTVVVRAQQSIEETIGRGGFGTLPYEEYTTFEDGKFAARTVVRDETVDASIPSRLYQIAVTIDWVDDAGVARSMTFTTFSPIP